MPESFHNKSIFIISWENVSANDYVEMYKVFKQNNLLYSQNETPSKRKMFDCTRWFSLQSSIYTILLLKFLFADN